MTAAMRTLKPIFGGDLPDERYACRPGRNDQRAAIDVDADLAEYSGSIPHAELNSR
jgi:RNA-directed DNA polymerase